MKNTIILFISLFASIYCLAQSSNVQNTIIYALPKTVLSVEVEIEKTTYTPGIFNQYAVRYLAAKDVNTEVKMYHTLKNIRVKTEAVPDENRTYSVSWNNKNAILYNIAINEKGILCGINTVCEPKEQPKENVIVHPSMSKGNLSLLPMSEEYMMVTSTAKLAEGAAKQIYRIRENRLDILAGDATLFPADGKSFALLLEEMEKMERELTELFVGTTVCETQIHTIYYTPENPTANDILFRLSMLNGVVPTTDLSGSPYYINIATTTSRLVASSYEADKKSNPIIRTIYPAVAQITVDDGRVNYFSGEFSIPQFGSIVELTDNVLRNKDVKVRVDTETGRLLGIE